MKATYTLPRGFLCLLLLGLLWADHAHAQRPIRTYTLVLRQQEVKKAGLHSRAITINGSLPGPTLYFTEGDSAVIHIVNDMKVPSSIHWHGLLIPSYYDGVPYLNTPPIAPGKTFTVRFAVRQSGTYWYHSHSMFEEQRGLFGAIVIHPRKPRVRYDRELVLVLSDWTNERPEHIMNNLKRNTEWYAIKKHSAQSLVQVLSHHGFGERFSMAWQRMPTMDISDVYYPAFLTNGVQQLQVPDLHPGERIRLRIIDGSSSTFFHLQFAGGPMQVIAADGQPLQPVSVKRMLIGIAETYDVLVTLPDSGAYEFRATAQDGSGYTAAELGSGPLHAAPSLPKPDLFHMEGILMGGMGGMKMRMNGMTMNMSDRLLNREAPYIRKAYLDREDLDAAGTQNIYMGEMTGKAGMVTGMNADAPAMPDMSAMSGMPMGTDTSEQNASMNDASQPEANRTDSALNYDLLRALHPTAFSPGHPIRHLTFNLTGSMWRYIWSINGKPLSEDDSIDVHQGEVLRITLNNATMMYHPMHLHGHFFRVLNQQGRYAPLKHTVIVPPMRSVTLEFLANEPGNWFFHCHVLYHMMAGMARTFQYAGYHAPDTMAHFPLHHILHDDKMWYGWGNATLASNMARAYLSYSNRTNWFRLEGDYGWSSGTHEFSGTYEYFATRYLRPYVGLVSSNKDAYLKFYSKHQRSVPHEDVRGVVGLRYLLPLFVHADLRLDNRGHVRFGLEGETWLLPRTWLHYSWNSDLEYDMHLEQRLSQYLSLTAGYSSDYRWGAGFMARF